MVPPPGKEPLRPSQGGQLQGGTREPTERVELGKKGGRKEGIGAFRVMGTCQLLPTPPPPPDSSPLQVPPIRLSGVVSPVVTSQ